MKYFHFIIFFLAVHTSLAQNIWDADSYPDESGYQMRMKPMIERIAKQGYGKRSLATSKCPDTGLPVKVWAVEGETIISPYTGRAYIQGPTGYFGPRARNSKGEISLFGGDPLKKDLPPATAALILNPDDKKAKAFLSIEGNLRQQYHFACVNWARFYPLLADNMNEEWHRKFQFWVNDYKEQYKYSNEQKRFEITYPHDLVGEKEGVFGGNARDGGTENHKVMWRTSGLLFSQLFPDSAGVSGYPVSEAESRIKDLLRKFVKQLLTTGNGEYDSQTYYPHSIRGFLNLYDFSPDEETKMLAKVALDYYYATYGLKTIDGMIAGPQNRGYLATSKPSEMEIMQHTFFDNVSRNMDKTVTTIHQATTNYRPNEVIWNLTRKDVALPFEARMNRSFMHLDRPFSFAETFYCSKNFALGNVQMVNVDNPNQQMVWSIVTSGKDQPLCFSGGHSLRGSTSGHSPYTQTLHSKGTLMLMTAPTLVLDEVSTDLAPTYRNTGRINLWHLPFSEHGSDFERKNRKVYGSDPLHSVEFPNINDPTTIDKFWSESKGSASSWFYFPSEIQPISLNGRYFFETEHTIVAVLPVNKEAEIIAPEKSIVVKLKNGQAKKFFQDYSILAVAGQTSGYVVEVVEKEAFASIRKFNEALTQTTKLDLSKLETNNRWTYTTIYGEKMEMQYEPSKLRCQGKINGKKQNWDKHTKKAVYESPYLSVKDGKFSISDGKQGYTVYFEGNRLVWRND